MNKFWWLVGGGVLLLLLTSKKAKSETRPLAPGTPAPPQEVTAPIQYTVKAGDSLSMIAEKFTGTFERWTELYDLNKSVIGPNPDYLKVGTVLTLPASWVSMNLFQPVSAK